MAQISLSGAAFGGMLLPGTPLRTIRNVLSSVSPHAQRSVRSGPSWPFASGPWQRAQRAANSEAPARIATSSASNGLRCSARTSDRALIKNNAEPTKNPLPILTPSSARAIELGYVRGTERELERTHELR